MRIKSEVEILDPSVRADILKEIADPENRRRKDRHYKRHLVYKDMTSFFVRKLLQKQFDERTVEEMSYALSNVSVTRKVIDKLARVYNGGVNRTVVNEAGEKDDAATDKLNDLEDALDINTHQKTINRYLKLHRNDVTYLKPCPITVDGEPKMTITPQAISPYLYDVVEDYYDRTKSMVYILSNYEPQDMEYSNVDAAREGRSVNAGSTKQGDGVDQKIADKKEDEGLENRKRYYIWWCDKYHFTTDGAGCVVDADYNELDISTEEGLSKIINEAGEHPFVDYGIDRDSSYWAEGGDDLSDGTCLINSLLTHLNHVSITQGYGQFWMTGKNLPRNITVGPNKAIILEYEDKDDPTPQLGYANAAPNLSDMMSIVEMHVALLLTTNNLSTSGISTQLSQQGSFASGIALLIDKSESMEDVQDQQQVFLDNEPVLWAKLNRWLTFFSEQGTLDPELKELVLPPDVEIVVSFPEQRVIQSEKEKLENIQLRKDLGLNTMAELIKMDQPDLSDKQAEEKLAQVAKEKKDRMLDATTVMGEANGGAPDAGAENQFNQPENDIGSRPGAPEGNIQ